MKIYDEVIGGYEMASMGHYALFAVGDKDLMAARDYKPLIRWSNLALNGERAAWYEGTTIAECFTLAKEEAETPAKRGIWSHCVTRYAPRHGVTRMIPHGRNVAARHASAPSFATTTDEVGEDVCAACQEYETGEEGHVSSCPCTCQVSV